MNNSVFGKTLENIRNMVDIRLISTDKVTQKLAAKLYFNNPFYLGMSILDLSKSLILRLNMGIRQNYSSSTLTLSHMKLRPKIFTKISTQTLRNGLTLVTTQLIIHLELKQDLIVKCLECLRMKLAGSRLLNLLV